MRKAFIYSFLFHLGVVVLATGRHPWLQAPAGGGCRDNGGGYRRFDGDDQKPEAAARGRTRTEGRTAAQHRHRRRNRAPRPRPNRSPKPAPEEPDAVEGSARAGASAAGAAGGEAGRHRHAGAKPRPKNIKKKDDFDDMLNTLALDDDKPADRADKKSEEKDFFDSWTWRDRDRRQHEAPRRDPDRHDNWNQADGQREGCASPPDREVLERADRRAQSRGVGVEIKIWMNRDRTVRKAVIVDTARMAATDFSGPWPKARGGLV